MKINPDVIFRKEFDGTGLLYNAENGKAFYLNKVSTLICELLNEGKDRDAVLEALPSRVNNLPDDIGAVLDAFISQLKEKAIFQD